MAGLLPKLSPYMNTDISAEDAVAAASRMLNVHLGEDSFLRPSGETVIAEGEDGKHFEDFYPDPDSVREIYVRAFCREVSAK